MDTNKVLYDDIVPAEDAMETQVMNCGNETQILDDPDVTGSTDTQVIDEFSDRDSIDSDGEASDRTEVLGGDDELSDDEYGRGDKEVQCLSYDDREEKQFVDQSTDLSHQQSSSASVPRFVSVRTEALRLSPLVAQRNKNSVNHSGNGYCSVLNISHSSQQSASESNILKTSGCDEMISEPDTGGQNGKLKELDNGIKSKVNSSTVRALFNVGSTIKDGGLFCSSSITEPKELTQSPTVEELAGLSYVDSQEPGEASQADALAFVERLIDETKASFENENDVNLENLARRRSDSISAARGPQSLAKKTINRGIRGGNTVFDWDNGREDEGGGEFFIRRKEDLVPGKEICRSLTNPANRRSKTRNVCRGNQGNSEVGNQMTVHSDSKIVVQKLKATETETNRTLGDTRKDLLGEFCEHANRNELEESSETMIPSDLHDVGLDTQLAADAMEALLNGDPIPDFGCDDAKQKHSVQQSPLRKAKRRVSPKHCASNNNDAENNKRQSKKIKRSDAVSSNQTRKMTRKVSGKVDMECDARPRLMTRRVKCDSDSKIRNKLPSKTSESEDRGSILGIQHDVLTKCDGFALRRRQTVNKQQENVGHAMKARRTRQSCVVSSLRIAENVTVDVDEYRESTREHPDCEQSPAGTCSGETPQALNLMADINHLKFPRKPRSKPDVSEQPKDHNDLDMRNSHGLLRRRKKSKGVMGAKSDVTSHTGRKLLAEKVDNLMPGKLRKGVIERSISASPVGYVTPAMATTSRKRKVHSLCTIEPEPVTEMKDSRKRRDLEDVRVLFSHHLDEDVIKRQKKIVERLKVSTASSIMDATHFVTDRFVRTRNMLEAIASGKPVVTPLWLEHVGRAKYFIDEQKYIMRDAKKEKEIGFNLAASLAHARQRPLLQGQKVLITQNAKPSKEILSDLIKAVHGKPIEKVGRSALKDETLTQELLVLSSEEDYEICVPFLKRGAAVYSSELLLNGIVTWKLEYDRHRLFVDHVKTR
ncbi:PAX-interacting protein 1 [Linum grandiflorum]